MALRGKKYISVITDTAVDAEGSGEPSALIIAAVGGNPLRAVQSSNTGRDVWEKIQLRYAGKTNINRLRLLNGLWSMIVNKGDQMGDQIPTTETKFIMLAAMNDFDSESMTVKTFFSSLSKMSEYAAIAASINKGNANEVNGIYVSMIFIRDSERHSNQDGLQEKDDENITVVASTVSPKKKKKKKIRRTRKTIFVVILAESQNM